jgi:PAS domain-containing protein
MLAANPSHRAPSARRLRDERLAESFNAFADASEALRRDVGERVREANERIEQERNRLAALMSELAQSVIMCNVEGRILLYNARAMQLLSKPLDAPTPPGKAHSLVGPRALDLRHFRPQPHHPRAGKHSASGRARAPAHRLRPSSRPLPRGSSCGCRWRRFTARRPAAPTPLPKGSPDSC